MVKDDLKSIKDVLRNFVKYGSNFVRVLPFVIRRKELTYFPEEKHKSLLKLYLEMFKLVYKEGFYYGRKPTLYTYYFLGLDRADRVIDNYLWNYSRNMLENIVNGFINYSYFAFTDKFTANIILNHYKLPSTSNIGIIETDRDDNLIIKNISGGRQRLDSLELDPESQIVAKPLNGRQGDGVSILKYKELPDFINKPDNRLERYIVEKPVENHEQIARIYAGSVNTIRIVTINKRNDPGIYAASMRIGNNGSSVDNIAKGGIAVRIDIETGKLNSLGYQAYPFGKKCTIHPDSGVVFKEYQLPYWEEIKEVVVKGHGLICSPFMIGWDIAVTPTGPVIIELNRFPGLDNVQIDGKGLGYLLKEVYYPEIRKYNRQK